jgi:hypothetical protein
MHRCIMPQPHPAGSVRYPFERAVGQLQTRSRAGSTGPGIVARPGTRLKPDLP